VPHGCCPTVVTRCYLLTCLPHITPPHHRLPRRGTLVRLERMGAARTAGWTALPDLLRFRPPPPDFPSGCAAHTPALPPFSPTLPTYLHLHMDGPFLDAGLPGLPLPLLLMSPSSTSRHCSPSPYHQHATCFFPSLTRQSQCVPAGRFRDNS